MDFHTIEFEEDLEELEADELRELVSEFVEAQDANLEQFEDASERVADLEEYDDEISEKLTETSPLSEAEVSAISFSRKRELLEEFTATGEPADDPEGDEGGDGGSDGPEQFGQQGPTHEGGEGEETPEFVEKAFDGVAGVEL